MYMSAINRLSENTKSENFGVDTKEFMTRKSVKITILGQPVKICPYSFILIASFVAANWLAIFLTLFVPPPIIRPVSIISTISES